MANLIPAHARVAIAKEEKYRLYSIRRERERERPDREPLKPGARSHVWVCGIWSSFVPPLIKGHYYPPPLSTQTQINSRRTGLVKKVSRCPINAMTQHADLSRCTEAQDSQLNCKEGKQRRKERRILWDGRTDDAWVDFAQSGNGRFAHTVRPSNSRSDDLACRFCKLHGYFARGAFHVKRQW